MFKPKATKCHLQSLLREVLLVLTHRLDERRLEVQIGLGSGCKAWFEADSQRIQQVLLNILSNAIKFAYHASTILLKVSLKADAVRGDKYLQFCVIDRGLGIGADQLDKVTRPYYKPSGKAKDYLVTSG